MVYINVPEGVPGIRSLVMFRPETGKSLSDIDAARDAGANDLDIHDTVLIAATFSMFNRYVDGLASLTPENREDYVEMGKRLAEKGYVSPATVQQNN